MIKNYIPWTEKYRPNKLNDFVLEFDIKVFFKNIINKRINYNILISGPIGCGKTSLARYYINKLFGKYSDLYSIEISSSNLKTQEQINSFCRTKKIENKFPEKIIFFDEADNMTDKYINYILSIMNNTEFSNIYFIFTTNDSSKLSKDIQSRSQIIKILTPKLNNIVEKLNYICKKENCKRTINALKLIGLISQNDIRTSINILESIAVEGPITIKNVTRIRGVPSIKNIISIIEIFADKQMDKNNKIYKTCKLYDDLINKGNTSNDIVSLLTNILKLEELDIDEYLTIEYLDNLNRLSNNLNKGYKNSIHVYATFANICFIDLK